MDVASTRSVTLILTILLVAGCAKEQPSTQEGSSPQTTSIAQAAPAAKSAVASDATAAPIKKFDGPFGLKMGLTRAEVAEIVPHLKPHTSPETGISDAVPVPHPYFESYIFSFSDNSGLCKITAVGKDIQTGHAGAEIKSQFDSLDEALTSKYGKGKKFDYSTERYSAQEYWMLHLLQKNQTLAKGWGKITGATLPNTLKEVFMQASATNISTGYISLSYDFDNVQDCAAENTKRTNQAL